MSLPAFLRAPARVAGAFVAALVLATLFLPALRAQAPALFVKLATGQVTAGTTPAAATTATITAPGSGWDYSAAAPVPGTTWNQILRPNPLIGSNSTSTVGEYLCNSASAIALTSATGQPTGATLSVWLNIQDLEGNTTRTEPNAATAGNTVLSPAGLMAQCWRIYRGGNGTIHRVAGLPPGAHYYLYVYGTTTTTSQGARFNLDAGNVPAGSPAFVEIRGGNSGHIFTTDGTTISLTAPATPGLVSTAADNNSWGRLHAVVDATGVLTFRTVKNSANGQYLNGYQLVPYPRATITLQPPPTPLATVGSDVTLTITATGDGAITYQWRKNGTPITAATNASATTPSLTLSAVTAADAATYDVVITNPGGPVTSDPAVLTVTNDAIAPTITTPPQLQTALTGQSRSFTVVANGTAPLVYQWQFSTDGVAFTDLPGATASLLSLPSITTAHAGHYRAVVTNSVDSATSAVATLTVAPVITTAPTGGVIAAGSPTSLTVVADAGAGAPTPTAYEWRRDGTLVTNGGGISGATTATLGFAGLAAAQSGYYTVTASNPAGAVTTAAVYLGVPSTQAVVFAPGNHATGLAIDQQLRLVFPAPPKLGATGSFRIHDAATDAVVVTVNPAEFVSFPLFGATVVNAKVQTLQGKSVYYLPAAIYGSEVWITLPAAQRLSYGQTYYVTMDAGFLLDSTNAAVPALTSPTAWRFSTKPAGPATPTVSTGPTEITVGPDGTGDFATIQGASDWIPQNNTLPRTIRVLPGVHRDLAFFSAGKNFVTLLGGGARREDTTLLYHYPAELNGGGARGFGSLRLDASDVTVRNLTVDNEVYVPIPSLAGGAHPAAPAFAGPIQTVVTTGRRLVFDNVLIKGGQDTLYTITGIAHFFNSEIWGSVDFIYGDALAVFDRCDIVQIRTSGGPVCAPSTPSAQPFGEVFLNCRFPRARVADGYPYDVGAGTTTFMRPWRQDGHVAIINCQLDTHFSTKAWSEWDGRENTCRARETGSTLPGGGPAPTPAQRRAAGAYWLNTLDPDYTSTAMAPTDPLLALPSGPANRTTVAVDAADYTLAAIYGHPYFALGGWLPDVDDDVPPTVTTDPSSQTVTAGHPVTFTVAATGSPVLTYQWRKDTAPIAGATAANFTLATTQLADAAAYDCVVTNASGSDTSAAATLTVLTPFAAWAASHGLDASAPDFATADDDGDGVTHLLEFYLRGDPLVPDAAAILPTVSLVEDAAGRHLVLAFLRAVGAADLPLVIETSLDLVTWTARTSGVDATLTTEFALGPALNLDVNLSTGGHHTGTAAAPDPGTTWNSFVNTGSSVTLPNLLDSAGEPTTADFTVTSSAGFNAWSNATNGTPTPLALMQDYLFGNTYTVTLGDLTPGAYLLYVYAHGDQDNQTSTITLATANGGATGSTTTAGNNAFRDALAPGAEGIAYVVLTPTVGATGVLQFTVAPYLNGFQLLPIEDLTSERVRITIPAPPDTPRFFARLKVSY